MDNRLTLGDQRRLRVFELIESYMNSQNQETTQNLQWQLIDIGCGEGKFMRYMINSRVIPSLIGIDIDTEALQQCLYECKPNLYDKSCVRTTKTMIDSKTTKAKLNSDFENENFYQSNQQLQELEKDLEHLLRLDIELYQLSITEDLHKQLQAKRGTMPLDSWGIELECNTDLMIIEQKSNSCQKFVENDNHLLVCQPLVNEGQDLQLDQQQLYFKYEVPQSLQWQFQCDRQSNLQSNIQSFGKKNVVSLIEVIEHVYLEQLDMLTYNIFGILKPSIVIMTTPNFEFNKYFGNKDRIFRNSDHKFEFTLKEFNSFCQEVIKKYPQYICKTQDLGIFNYDDKIISKEFKEIYKQEIITQVVIFTKIDEKHQEETYIIQQFDKYFHCQYREILQPVLDQYNKQKLERQAQEKMKDCDYDNDTQNDDITDVCNSDYYSDEQEHNPDQQFNDQQQ